MQIAPGLLRPEEDTPKGMGKKSNRHFSEMAEKEEAWLERNSCGEAGPTRAWWESAGMEMRLHKRR